MLIGHLIQLLSVIDVIYYNTEVCGIGLDCLPPLLNNFLNQQWQLRSFSAYFN
jgi:hypothetical protein